MGTVGFLSIFAWSVIVVALAPARFLPWLAGICLLIAALCYPRAFRRLIQVRPLVLIALLSLPPIFLIGDIDRSLGVIGYSSEGLGEGVQIAVRIIVVLIAVDGLTGSVDISALAGLLERAGLHGLGFSIGVALNLLPSLQQSALNAWRSLLMRGGLRKKRWRGLQLLAFTIVANALSRAEEIALAAEARAFSPELARSLPVKVGRLDWVILFLSAAGLLSILFLRF
jgi:energy-coupling factor transporter transmembrane protein EcfT